MTVDKKVSFKKSSLVNLRAIIKGCALEACKIRNNEIRKLEKQEKWDAWQRKRELGQFARYHLLAYGFLTGRKYEELESGNPCVNDRKLIEVLKQHKPELFHVYGWKQPLSEKDVIDWSREGTLFFLTKEEALAKKTAEEAKKKMVAA